MTEDSIFFSIITVCYNSEETILKTITSVLNQTFTNFEYIIIDGNSTDNTLEIIKNNEHKFNGKLKYVSESDKGIYDAMNKGILIAQGEFIGLLNSDDWYNNDTLENVYNYYLNDRSIDVFYGLMNFYKNDEFYKVECVHHNFLDEAPLYHQTCFISSLTYRNLGLYDKKYKLASDYEYFYRCRNKNIKFKYIPEILANFSLNGATTKHKYLSLNETLKIRYKYKVISIKQYLKQKLKLYLSQIKKTFLK